ncbi:MAG: beta-N-acetylglucosaminidase domain-containing protein, partial [Clostridiales bacterium]|nr:beta-N-acetylglucosaminidase domain-containing protein [Clostridiales bacterium]
MKSRGNKQVLALLLAGTMLSTTVSPAFALQPPKEGMVEDSLVNGFSEDQGRYEIYPVPHSVVYPDGAVPFTMTKEVNVVVESGIDSYTKDFLEEILADYDMTMTTSSAVVAGKTNILLGVYGDEDKTVADPVPTARTDLFDDSDSTGMGKYDPYMLVADTTNNANGVVTIVGKDTDCVYYGLATLQMMFSSFAGQKFLPVEIEDYSNNLYRGVIEGFYGGWDVENRESVMRMGRDVKMNIFVYASKTDKYHTSDWDKLYPEDQMKDFKRLVEVGKETKVEFVWSVHLGSFFKGGVSTDPSNEAGYAEYNRRFDLLTKKLDQFYAIGVRQFHILNDDFGSGTHADAVNLLNRIMTDYVDKKGDCATIVYCPQHYNVGRAETDNGEELASFKNLDSRIPIYWTGATVNSPVEQKNYDYAYDRSGHDIVTWLNYPCNEHTGGRGIFLGDSQAYLQWAKGLKHHLGIISNPCNKPQVSKVGIYQLMCWNWNNESYDENYLDIWEDCFKYLQPEVYDAYLTIARNVGAAVGSNVPSRFPGRNPFPESDYLKDTMAAVLEKTKNGTLTAEDPDFVKLRDECQHIVEAIAYFKEHCTSAQLIGELNPWLSNLEKVAQAIQPALQAAVAVNSDNLAEAWAQYNAANTEKKSLNTYGGSKRLQPFITDLMEGVSTRIFEELSPQVSHTEPTLYAVIGGVRQEATASNAMLDGNAGSAAKYDVAQQANDYYGVDLGIEKTVRGVSILQGEKDEDSNYYHNATLEYSQDGIQWITLVPEVDSTHITLSDLAIRARYLRLRQTEDSSSKLNVREFTVDTSAGTFTSGAANEQNAMDGNLLTAFNSSAAGELVYTLKKPVHLDSVSVIQNSVSNASVTVKVGDNWETVGTADNTVWVGDTSQLGDISAIKVAWAAGSNVSIAEILLNGRLDEGEAGKAPLPLPSIYTAPNPEIEVEVAFGTELDRAGLPAQGTVTLSNGKEVTLPVVWSGEDYDPTAAKEYTVTGNYVLGDTITNPGGFALTAVVAVRRDSSTPQEPFAGNLALNKAHQASGVSGSSDDPQSWKALDGDPSNRWCAGPAIKETGSVDAPQTPGVEWIIVDLNTGKDGEDLSGTNELTDITLKCYTDKSWPTKYDIYVSDEPFTVQDGKVSGGTKAASASYDPTDQKGHDDQVTVLPEGTSGRYVCVVFNEINKYATGATGISVAELKINGTKTYSAGVGAEENLSLEHPVYASGMELSSGFEPSKSVDGDTGTRWSSNWVGPEVATDSNGAWIVIDLGEDVADVTGISMSYFNKTWSDEYWIQVAGSDYTPQDYSKENLYQTMNNKEALTGQNAKDANAWTTIATVTQSGTESGATHSVAKADFTKPIPAGTRYLRLYFEKGNSVIPRESTCIGLKEVTVTGTRFVAPAEPNVESVKPATATGVLGTAFGDLNLPETVAATLADGTSITLNVTWSDEGYNSNSAEQTLTGTLQCQDPVTNTDGVKAELHLTLTEEPKAVSAAVNPASVTAQQGTAFAELGLPTRAVVEMSDSTFVVCNVAWTESDYAAESEAAQTIHGTLDAVNDLGVTITVERPDTTAPAAPAGLAASGVTQTGATVTWTPSAEADLAGYRVYLNGASDPVADITASTYAFSGLTPNAEYTVTVTAYDRSGNESQPASCTFKTETAVMHHIEYILYNASVDPKTDSVMDGTDLTFKLVPAEGYILPETISVTMGGTALEQGKGYTYDAVTGNVTISNINAEVLIRADAIDPNAPKTVTVTFESNGGSSVPEQTVEVGSTVAEPEAPVREGYVFAGWYTDNIYTTQWNFSDPVNESMTLYAKWEDNGSGGVPSTSYAITVDETDNGTVTSSRTRASKGLTITLTVKSDEGYKLDTITVTDKNGSEVKLTDKGDGKYTFAMPASAVTVKAAFVKDDTPVDTDTPFTDVKADEWFYEAVKYVCDNKLMDGTSSTTFAPLMITNRAMIVTILWRLEGQPKAEATLSFTDVESGVWYTDAVNWAASKGIVKGYSDTVFAPNDTVTREQLATILYRYAESKGYDVSAKGDLTTFADGANTSSWAAEAMEWAVGSGLLSGKDGGKLDPTGT